MVDPPVSEAEHPEKQDPAEAVLNPAEVLMAAVTDMRMMTMMNGMIMQMDRCPVLPMISRQRISA